MSEETKQPEAQSAEPAPVFDPNKDLKVGYIVGVDQEDKFIFEAFGTERNVVSLLGVNAYANSRCKNFLDMATNTGDAALMNLTHLFKDLVSKLDILLRPSNKV